MADTGSLIAGFVKGATGYTLKTMDDRNKAEAEMRKTLMLEQLRRETAKEMALFEEDLPSARLRREQTEQNMVLDREKFALDRTNTEQQMRLREEDQAIQRERLSLERLDSADRRATNAAQRKSLSTKSEGEANKKVLYTDFNNVYTSMKEQGANNFELSAAMAQWREGTMMKGWTQAQQKAYISELSKAWRKKVDATSVLPALPGKD